MTDLWRRARVISILTRIASRSNSPSFRKLENPTANAKISHGELVCLVNEFITVLYGIIFDVRVVPRKYNGIWDASLRKMKGRSFTIVVVGFGHWDSSALVSAERLTTTRWKRASRYFKLPPRTYAPPFPSAIGFGGPSEITSFQDVNTTDCIK